MRKLTALFALLVMQVLLVPQLQAAVDCSDTAVTGIPQIECEALVALYNSTDGPNWSDAATNNWIVKNMPCSWTGVRCGEGRVTWIDRADKNLSGGIPAELGNLRALQELVLHRNQLTGSLPSTLGNLNALTTLLLSENKLGGNLPAGLSNLTSLTTLWLHSNQFSGTIPDLPSSLTGTDLAYNAFSGETVGTATTEDPDWAASQTRPPTNLSAIALSDTQTELTWTPIAYAGDGGYYQVEYATTAGGLYTSAGVTADKSSSSYTISGLTPNTTYYFVLSTYTPAHGYNRNALTSENSVEVSARTESVPAVPSKPIHGLNFGPYIYSGQSPGATTISESQLRDLISYLSPYTRILRTFGSNEGLEKVPCIASEYGLQVALRVWLGEYKNTHQTSISEAIAAAQACPPAMIIVGSEDLYRGEVTKSELLGYLQQVKQALADRHQIRQRHQPTRRNRVRRGLHRRLRRRDPSHAQRGSGGRLRLPRMGAADPDAEAGVQIAGYSVKLPDGSTKFEPRELIPFW